MKEMTEDKLREHDALMLEIACRMAEENVGNGGGPFGAVITDSEGRIVSVGANSVTRDNDPTAHAEVNAVRDACRRLRTFQLTGCTVYSSCEPCPMCLSALYWAGVARVVFGNTKEDAEAINFSDRFIYDELAVEREARRLPAVHMVTGRAIKAFEMWAAKKDKVEY